MSRLVKSELLKWRTTKMWFGLTLGGMLGVALITLISALTSGRTNGNQTTPPLSDPGQLRAVYSVGFSLGAIFTLVLGVIAICGEFRHQTITPTFLATPRRNRVIAAKIAGTVLAALVMGIALVATSMVIGGIVTAAKGYPLRLGSDKVPETLLLSLLGLVVWALLGLGVGTLLRNQIAAILTVVGFSFIAEPLITLGLRAMNWYTVAKLLPGAASTAMTSPTGRAGEHVMTWWGGTITLLCYGAVAAALGTWITLRRDVS